jgi:hypothetical protein
MLEPQREIDVTELLITAIAQELWRACGGNDHLNWIEAESHLRQIIGLHDAPADAGEAGALNGAASSLSRAGSNGSAKEFGRARNRMSESRALVATQPRRGRRAGAVRSKCLQE